MLDLGIDLDVWPWLWLVIAVVFALVELFVVAGSFIVLPFAVSAFAASMLGFADASIEVQWTVFVVGGVALFAVLFRWARRYSDEAAPTPGVGARRLVGLAGIVTVAIDPDDTDRRGRVSVSGETWGALAAGPHGIPVGAHVRIVSVVGTRLVVEVPGDVPDP